MAASPANIVRRCSYWASEHDGIVYERVLIRRFLDAGYGPTKAKRWIDTYIASDILEIVNADIDEDAREHLGRAFKSSWWVPL